uniref:Ddb1 and cul4 associated factor 17 n=1 Tax=Gadus morhua TaxID=8049 RepID=A0A8C5CWK6_GADMO
MTCPRRKRQTNTTCMLARRSRGFPDYGNILRANMRMLRAIVLQEDRNFIKVWSKTSKSTIAYDSGKIYFENYQSCYSCIDTHPQLLYKLPQRSKSEKIEDALQCSSPLEKSLSTPSDQKPCLLTLTANNWLYRLSAETGETLQGVYLSPNPKFKYLQWDEYQDRFYVKSIQNKVAPFARQAGITQNTVMHLAIFNVFPLEIVGMLEINKTVYCPPVLFEVSCSDHNVQIGGHPWHYIYTPPHKKHRGTYHICSLAEGILAKNGIQDMDCCSLETDLIYLHPDESGRIIHVGPNTCSLRRLPPQMVNSLFFSLDQVAPRVTVTSSGRTVKRISQQLDDDPDQETFRTVEYEDEVDLLALVVTDGEEGEGRACVKLHDNSSGVLLKTIPLEQAWDVTYRNEMCFDKETIVHIEERNNGFHCHVYKLQTEAK